MYAVSDEFLEAVAANTRSYYWAGMITTTAGKVYEFGYSDILKGSGYISSQCCGSTEIELGTVYSSEMGITLLSEVDRYTLEDAIVEISCFLRLADGSYEEVPMGVFEVSEANRTAKCIEIKAYDYMLRFETSFNGFQSTGTAYDFINLCCLACSVEMAQTQEEIEAMANGSETLSIYSEEDIETYRDVLYYVGQVLGGFFVINREGKLELRKDGSEAVLDIAQKHRFTSSFSDFITRYTAVSSTNMRTETAEYYSVDPDDGLTMNLGVNPLLQFGLDETRAQLCTNILEDLQAVNYVPFDSDTIGNPALDLGDVLTFSGGQADEDQITCITSIKYTIGGRQTLKCVGKNPKLSQAKSKNDKNISGLLSQIEEGKMGLYTYTNASAYTIADSNTKIISMEFTAKEATYAEFIAQVVVEIAADAVERSATASGSATLLWIKISKEDYTYTEASFTLSNATMTYAGYRSYSSYPSYRNKCVVRDGCVYIPSYDAAGVYKIKLDNSADVTLISLGFTSAGYSLSGGSYGLFLDRIEDLIIGYDFQIKADDTVIQTVGSKRFEYSGTPMFRYKNFLLYWGGEYSIKKRYLALLTPYMAAIGVGAAVSEVDWLRVVSIAAVAGLVSILTSLASLDVICEDTEYADAYDDTRVESS